MKIKRLREDFLVHEVSTLPIKGGPHAVYRLQKSGIGTPEAITEVVNIWNLVRQDVHYGGMKDRHASTTQQITIFNGPRDSIQQSGFSLDYLGQSPRCMSAADIAANEFHVTIRSLKEAEALRFSQIALGSAGTSSLCIPNYFDDQRFGSLGESGQFIAQPWCLGDYERALFLAIAEANPHDRSDDREQKEILREHWGQWQTCKDRLERSHRRSIVTYLVDHPVGFKKAVALIRKDLRGIYVAAFQGKLWNEVVVRYVQQQLPNCEFLTSYGAGGKLLFPLGIDALSFERLSTIQIPLPSGRKTEWRAGIAEILDVVLEEFGLLRHKLRFSYPRDVFFARGARDLLLRPQGLKCSIEDDELSETSERKLTLQFQLLPGQYATMLLKSIEMLAAPR